MIRGERIILRTVRQADLDELYELNSDIKDFGEFVPITLFSEPLFKKEFKAFCEIYIINNNNIL